MMYTADAAVRSLKAEALAKHEGKAPKYHLRAGRDYLHWSCTKLTPERSQAWRGTVEQGRACRRKFDAAAGCKLTSITPIPEVTT